MLTRNQRAALALPLPLPMPNHDRFRNLQGQRFGRLFVQSYATRRKSSGTIRHYWLCDCDCSKWAVVEATALTGGRTTSCGCVLSEVTTERNMALTVHGEAYGSVEYKTWERLKARCLNANLSKFEIYGGRGITVCDRWRDSFPAFLEDMGRRPPGKTSIDRIDGDRGYEPGNCRWADIFEQNRNRISRR